MASTPLPRTVAVNYSTAAFRREREQDWAAFEEVLDRVEGGSFSKMSDEDLLALPRLYRATLSSLSIARATILDAALIEYLEGLCMRGYFLIYGVRESRGRRLLDFFRFDWPGAVRALWRETLVVVVLLALGIGVSWALAAHDPEWFRALVPEGMAQGRGPDADAASLRQTIYGAPQDDALHIFAVSLFTHNSQVGITAYALGFAFGLPSLFLMLYQGLMLGPMLAVFDKAGLLPDFVGWLFIHGTTELFAASIAGAAGLRIGTAVAFPGARSRLAAAAQAGRETGAAMMGVIIMLLIAGLLEGFGRQLIQSMQLRYAIGAALLTMWLAYFYVPRRGGSGGRQ